MKNPDIYDKWTKFITSEKYKKYFMSNEEEWNNKFNEVKQYIDENNKTPSTHDKNKDIKALGGWVSHQQENYKSKKTIMKNPDIYDKWIKFITSEKYKKYFMSNEEEWNNKFNEVKQYIDENNKTPSTHDKNKDTKILGSFISTQQQNYKSKEQIMKNPDVYFKWTEFITSEKYKKYFMSNEEEWQSNLNLVKKYIDENNKRPSEVDKNKDTKKLANWISNQQQKYKLKEQIMKNPDIYSKWIEFINSEKYKNYFVSNIEEWQSSLNLIKKYIDENNKTPSKSNKNKNIRALGIWISNQQTHYKSKEHIMKNPDIYSKWTEFITSEKYKNYFVSNEDEWYSSLNLTKKYIDENNKRPSKVDKNKDIKTLEIWLSNQQRNYKSKEYIMKNLDIYSIWTKFITSEKYKKYFMSNDEEWQSNLNLIKKYIDKNNKRPSAHDKNKDIKKLGKWLSTQQGNYKSKEQIMKNPDIYDKWTVFINDPQYSPYFD